MTAARAYVAAGVLAAVGSRELHGVPQQAAEVAIGLSAVAVTACAVCRRRGPFRAPWLLGALGQLLFVAGDLVFDAISATGGAPFPSAADGCYLAGYAALAAALVLLVRVRTPGADWASLLDATIAGGGAATLALVLLSSRYAGAPLLDRSLVLGYVALDVLLLALGLRLALSGGHRNASFQLLVASLALLLFSDVAYGHGELTSSYLNGSVVDLGWLLSYVFWGAAALHASARELTSTATGPVGLRTVRLTLLAAASATSPTLLLLEWAQGDVRYVAFLACSAVLLALLVHARLALTLHQHESALAWERRVRDAVETFMAATGETAVAAAAVNAVVSWVLDADDVGVYRARGKRLVAAATAGDLVEGATVTLPRAVWRELRAGRVVESAPVGDELRTVLALGSHADALTLLPLVGDAGTLGVLAIATATPPTRSVRAAMEMIGLHTAHALDAALAEPETTLARQEAAFLSLLHGPDEFVAIVASDGTVSYHSPSVEAALGYADGELAGVPLARLLHPEDREELAAAESSLATVRLRRRDGTWARALVRTSPHGDDELIGGTLLTARIAA